MQVQFICAIKLKCIELIAKKAPSLTMSLFLKKSYKQRGHRFTTYEYLRRLLTLRSAFIISRKYYLLVKRSILLRVHLHLRLPLTTFSGTVACFLFLWYRNMGSNAKRFYNSNEEKSGKVYQARNICPKEWRE